MSLKKILVTLISIPFAVVFFISGVVFMMAKTALDMLGEI